MNILKKRGVQIFLFGCGFGLLLLFFVKIYYPNDKFMGLHFIDNIWTFIVGAPLALLSFFIKNKIFENSSVCLFDEALCELQKEKIESITLIVSYGGMILLWGVLFFIIYKLYQQFKKFVLLYPKIGRLVSKGLIILITLLILYYSILLILAYTIRVPAEKRFTHEEAAQMAQEYFDTVRTWRVDIGEVPRNPTTVIREEFFPVYSTRDDIPDYFYFNVRCLDNFDCPVYVGVSLLPEEPTIDSVRYFDPVSQVNGENGDYKIYRFSDLLWYGVPPSSPTTSLVKAYGLKFSQFPSAQGPVEEELTYTEFEENIKEDRMYLRKWRNSPRHRIYVFKRKVHSFFDEWVNE